MTMIERVAAAIAIAKKRGLDRNGVARSAIEAMRDPSDAMLAEARPEPFHLYPIRSEDYRKRMEVAVVVSRMTARSDWQIMIDAALKDDA